MYICRSHSKSWWTCQEMSRIWTHQLTLRMIHYLYAIPLIEAPLSPRTIERHLFLAYKSYLWGIRVSVIAFVRSSCPLLDHVSVSKSSQSTIFQAFLLPTSILSTKVNSGYVSRCAIPQSGLSSPCHLVIQGYTSLSRDLLKFRRFHYKNV